MPKLMVVLDPKDDTHSGLERLKEIPPNTDVDVHVCAFVEADVARDLAATLRSKKAWVEEVTKPFADIGYRVTQEVVTFSRLYEAIIQTAINAGADIIFKPMRQHSIARRMLVSSTDWNLIRLCPTPLYLVNSAVEVHGKPVLAAIDVSGRDDKHDQLNTVVMEQAGTVAGVVGGDLSCVNAWHVSNTVMATGSMDPTPYKIARDMQDDHVAQSRALGATYNVPESRVHVSEGTPEFVINETAKEVDAGCVVIGTVARTGMSGLFIGNTAESVVENALTDVMIVKSPDFECPL